MGHRSEGFKQSDECNVEMLVQIYLLLINVFVCIWVDFPHELHPILNLKRNFQIKH